MSHKPHTTVALAALLVLAVVAVPAPVAADHDDEDWLDGTLTDSSDRGLVDRVLSNPGAVASGVYGRLLGDTADNTASDAEQAVREYGNNRSDAFESWAASYVDARESRDVVRVVYEIGGESAEHIAQANVSDGDYTDLEVVQSTDRTVDYECTLEGDAARNAPDELATFDDKFVEEDQNVTDAYLVQMASRYGGQVSCEEV